MKPLATKKKIDEALGIKLSPDLLDLLAKFQEIELEDFELEVGDLELWFASGGALPAQLVPKLKAASAVKAKPAELMMTQFAPPVETYPEKSLK